jgi:hypothetical protein
MYNIYKILFNIRGENMDNNIMMTQEEKDKITRSYLKDGKLINLPSNKQKRFVVLESILKVFEEGREYTEREVNSILLNVYDDVFLIRRELVEWDLMNRTRDGRSYWVNVERRKISK